MATFRIGQRVKIARNPIEHVPQCRTKRNPGCFTGVLTEAIGIFDQLLTYGDFVIRLDNGITGTVYASQLEPVEYDGNQAITWDACCWRPEHERKTEVA